jgi:hypothetical protein
MGGCGRSLSSQAAARHDPGHSNKAARGVTGQSEPEALVGILPPGRSLGEAVPHPRFGLGYRHCAAHVPTNTADEAELECGGHDQSRIWEKAGLNRSPPLLARVISRLRPSCPPRSGRQNPRPHLATRLNREYRSHLHRGHTVIVFGSIMPRMRAKTKIGSASGRHLTARRVPLTQIPPIADTYKKTRRCAWRYRALRSPSRWGNSATWRTRANCRMRPTIRAPMPVFRRDLEMRLAAARTVLRSASTTSQPRSIRRSKV